MNEMYAILDDNSFAKLELCTCDECKKRGMFEVFIYDLKGEYIDCVKLDQIIHYVKHITMDKNLLFSMTRYFNPPLNFNELRPGMWVWHKKRRKYIKISHVFIRGNEKLYTWFDTALGDLVHQRYAQGHLFRYEVNKDDC